MKKKNLGLENFFVVQAALLVVPIMRIVKTGN